MNVPDQKMDIMDIFEPVIFRIRAIKLLRRHVVLRMKQTDSIQVVKTNCLEKDKKQRIEADLSTRYYKINKM